MGPVLGCKTPAFIVKLLKVLGPMKLLLPPACTPLPGQVIGEFPTGVFDAPEVCNCMLAPVVQPNVKRPRLSAVNCPKLPPMLLDSVLPNWSVIVASGKHGDCCVSGVEHTLMPANGIGPIVGCGDPLIITGCTACPV